MPATVEDSKIKVIEGSVAEKTHLMCRNAATVLEAAGSSLEKAVKATVGADSMESSERSCNRI